MSSVNRSRTADRGSKPGSPATTSQRLLDTAAHLFWTKGYASTTTREIAALLGVKKASLYHHVSSKEELLYEICVTSLGHIHATVRTAVETAEDPLDAVRRLIRAHLTAMLADQDKHSTMLTELRALTGDRRAEIVALRDAYEDLVRSVIARAQTAGEIRADIPVKQVAHSLLNLLNWAIFWFQPSGELSPEDLAETFIKIFINGVAREA